MAAGTGFMGNTLMNIMAEPMPTLIMGIIIIMPTRIIMGAHMIETIFGTGEKDGNTTSFASMVVSAARIVTATEQALSQIWACSTTAFMRLRPVLVTSNGSWAQSLRLNNSRDKTFWPPV